MEPDGIFGNPLADLTVTEGNYTFRAVAEFVDGCTASRETFWSAQVEVGIDAGRTTASTTVLGTASDGRRHVRVTVTPRDAFGNHLGPGRIGQFDVAPTSGSELTGALVDLGDGSYVHDVFWEPEPGSARPGLIITQPDRPPWTCPRRRPERAAGGCYGSSSCSSSFFWRSCCGSFSPRCEQGFPSIYQLASLGCRTSGPLTLLPRGRRLPGPAWHKGIGTEGPGRMTFRSSVV